MFDNKAFFKLPIDAVLSVNFVLLLGVKFMEISAVHDSSSDLTCGCQISTEVFFSPFITFICKCIWEDLHIHHQFTTWKTKISAFTICYEKELLFEWWLISSLSSLPRPNLEKANSIADPAQNEGHSATLHYSNLSDRCSATLLCVISKRYSRSHSIRYKARPSRSDSKEI